LFSTSKTNGLLLLYLANTTFYNVINTVMCKLLMRIHEYH